MTTTVSPEIESDHFESEEWPGPGRDLPDTAREERADSLAPIRGLDTGPHLRRDITQPRKLGAGPYDDPTQGRKIGVERYDDPTQGRKIGVERYDDPTRGRKIRADPYDDLTQGRKIGGDPLYDPTQGRSKTPRRRSQTYIAREILTGTGC